MRVQKPSAASLSGVLEQVVRESNGTLAWAQIVDREGAVIARSDAAAAPAFTVDYVASRIRDRRPIFAVRDTRAGKVVVEAFPIRLPSYSSADSFKSVALKSVAGNMAFVELASFVNAGVLAWPARWTLILGVTGGCALLGALVVLAVRFRSHLSARRVERQIEIASQVQRGLLPAANTSPRDFELAAEWRPASNVSGDFYDAFDLPAQDSAQAGVAFVVGDVSGKDVPAAMLASLIQGTAHASDWTRSAAESQRRHRTTQPPAVRARIAGTVRQPVLGLFRCPRGTAALRQLRTLRSAVIPCVVSRRWARSPSVAAQRRRPGSGSAAASPIRTRRGAAGARRRAGALFRRRRRSRERERRGVRRVSPDRRGGVICTQNRARSATGFFAPCGNSPAAMFSPTIKLCWRSATPERPSQR